MKRRDDPVVEIDPELEQKIRGEITEKLQRAQEHPGKQERNNAPSTSCSHEVKTRYCEPDEAAETIVPG